MNNGASHLRVGFIEPHVGRFGGIRRILELSNRLVQRGHDVTLYVPSDVPAAEDAWLPCRARVRAISDGLDDPLDALVFNHEPQWHLLAAFANARARLFYALHHARLYGKAGSWETLRADVDLVLANSAWTADMIKDEVGHRPPVLLGGVSHEYFHPVTVEKTYPILCMGDDRRPWKGTAVIEEAVRLLGLPLERYAGKELPQAEMAAEYCKAEVFVVGSEFEGFCQPGLEALACGVPLVTTDNGGCREYAIHEETALVVPPNDPEALADAIGRLRQDVRLARRLRANGLALVREKFDWDRSAEQLEAHLRAAVGAAPELHARARPALRRPVMLGRPKLSIVTPVWDQLFHTQAFVEAVRRNTDIPYELIIVDNGSAWEAANYAREAADVAIINVRNLGFAHALNQGLAAARGEIIAFCNNDTVVPPGWASTLVAHFDDPNVGIVVPAVTNAQHDRTVRSEPGETVETLKPFEAPPPAVVYLLRRETIGTLGGWGEEYEVASGEDTDLAFKVWVNGLDIRYDSRVLVEHVAKGTAETKLGEWNEVWKRNRELFLENWKSAEQGVPYTGHTTEADFCTRLQIARSVAWWMEHYFRMRSNLDGTRRKLEQAENQLATARAPADAFRVKGDAARAEVARIRDKRPKDGAEPPEASPINVDKRARRWLRILAGQQANGPPELVRTREGTVYVLDSGLSRPVKSGLLASSLEILLGPARAVADGSLAPLVEGPPVEVFFDQVSPPFVILAGQRHLVRGLPTPLATTRGEVAQFAEAPAAIDMDALWRPTRRFRPRKWLRELLGVNSQP